MEEIQRIPIELTFHKLLTFTFKMVYVITFLYVNNPDANCADREVLMVCTYSE